MKLNLKKVSFATVCLGISLFGCWRAHVSRRNLTTSALLKENVEAMTQDNDDGTTRQYVKCYVEEDNTNGNVGGLVCPSGTTSSIYLDCPDIKKKVKLISQHSFCIKKQ